jgi:hypothetical protein
MDTSFAFLTTRYDNFPDTMHPYLRHTVYHGVCSVFIWLPRVSSSRTGSSAIHLIDGDHQIPGGHEVELHDILREPMALPP